MSIGLVTRDDIPVLLRALESSWLDTVLASLGAPTHIEQRRVELRCHPFYAPFCGGSPDLR